MDGDCGGMGREKEGRDGWGGRWSLGMGLKYFEGSSG